MSALNETIDYGIARKPWPCRRIVKWAGGVLLILLILTLVPWGPTRHRSLQMDPVTGSKTITTELSSLFGKTTKTVTQSSPLEMRLKLMNASWTPSMQFIEGSFSSWPGTKGFECSRAPAIYELGPVQQSFVDASTDAEILAFVTIMQTGTEAEQKAAVEAACDKGLEAMAAK